MMLLTYHKIVEWLKGFMLTCPSKKLLHIECPGCGFQRSFFALLDGDVVKSLQLYPALMPIMVLIFFSIVNYKYQFAFNKQIIKYSKICSLLVVLLFYLYKLVSHQIFYT